MKHPNKHADDLIEMLATAIEAGIAPWQKPWRCDAKLPENLVTGRTYTGRNLLMLITAGAIADYNDHRWAGFQQIKAAGGHVRRGEHGHWICIMRSCGGGGRQQDSAETDLARNNPRGHGRSRNPKEGAGVHVHHVPAGVERSAVRGHRAARGRSEVLPIYIVGLGGRPPTFTIHRADRDPRMGGEPPPALKRAYLQGGSPPACAGRASGTEAAASMRKLDGVPPPRVWGLDHQSLGRMAICTVYPCSCAGLAWVMALKPTGVPRRVLHGPWCVDLQML